MFLLHHYVPSQGFARVSKVPFTLSDIDNKLIHLTNSWIQMNSTEKAAKFCTESKVSGGSKISLAHLRTKLADQGINLVEHWHKAVDVILKTLVSVEDAIGDNANCFEVYGFDLIIDDELKFWVLEVNASPSMEHDTPLDQMVRAHWIAPLFHV